MAVALLFSLFAAASPATIDVHVGAKAKLREVAVQRCRDGDRPIDRVKIAERGVAACRKSNCVTRPHVELACDGAVVRFGRETKTLGDRVEVFAEDGHLVVVAALPLEPYVGGVVRAELGDAPPAAREAQAIVARTYAMRAMVTPRHEHAHVCDLTHCQVYRPATETYAAGRVLLDDRGDVPETYFSGACGGRTRPARDAWPRSTSRAPGVSDLRPDGEPWCKDGRIAWRHEMDVEALAKLLSTALGRKLDPKSLELERSGDAFRVGDARAKRRVSAMSLAQTISKSEGWDTIESPDFEVTRRGRKVVFAGTGRGHGVGLCQAGAIARARAGQTAEQILAAYFPTYALSEVAGPPIRVGMTGDYPPFTALTPKGPVGVDVELAHIIGRELGRPVVFVRTSWPTLSADLEAGRFDVALSGIAVTKAREEIGAFSRPYHEGAKVAVVRCEDKDRLATLDAIDRPGVRVVVNPGGTNEAFVRKKIRNAEILVTQANLAIYAALEAREADALFTDRIEALYQIRRRKGLCPGAGGAAFEPFNIAAFAPKGSPIVAPINAILDTLESRDDLRRLFEAHQ